MSLKRRDSDCGSGDSDALLGLRIASIFIIYLGSTCGALFPVLARRSKRVNVPKALFELAPLLFISFLPHSEEELGSDCLPPAWDDYPYAAALCLLSIFTIFIVELVAFRLGTAMLNKIGMHHDAHGHDSGSHAAHGPEGSMIESDSKDMEASITPTPVIPTPETRHQQEGHLLDSVASQIIGVAILEFGVALHSVLIGLTLAVNDSFKILFVVLVFHQTFEGLGIGSRLAYMELSPDYNFVPILGAIIFGFTTPVGIAIGLGLRTAYDPNSPAALIVSGVLDSLSAGILIYTGLVELLAHEFLFSKEMMESSNAELAYALGSLILGCGLMALLGKWA